MLPAPKKPQPPKMATYLSKRVHGGVRPGNKADNKRLMSRARDVMAGRKAAPKP